MTKHVYTNEFEPDEIIEDIYLEILDNVEENKPVEITITYDPVTKIVTSDWILGA